MRYSITIIILCFVTAFIGAQSAPTPPEIISEDDLKLGIYDAPVFQPAARRLSVRQTEGPAKDGELLVTFTPDTTAPHKVYWTPSVIRLQLACRQKNAGDDVLDLLLKMLDEQAVSNKAVANKQ